MGSQCPQPHAHPRCHAFRMGAAHGTWRPATLKQPALGPTAGQGAITSSNEVIC